jgi:hypothetical protein
VRPKKSFLEVCVFLGRPLKHPRVRRVDPSSKSKFVHFIQVKHRDEVEAPITDWLLEAYDLAADRPATPPPPRGTARRKSVAKQTTKKKAAPKKKKRAKT